MFDAKILVDSIDNGVILIDEYNTVVFWNEWLELKSKILKEDAIGKKYEDLFQNKVNPKAIKAIKNNIELGQSTILTDRFHLNIFPIYHNEKKQQLMNQKIKIRRIINSIGKKFCLIIINDTTASRARENFLIKQGNIIEDKTRELEQQEKMVSLGRMASGIVHEINNPITVIKGNFMTYEHMKKKNAIEIDKVSTMFEQINKMADRVTHIIKGLKIIAHKDKYEFESMVSIKKIIEEAIELSDEKIKKSNISVEIDNIPTEYEIWCDEVQISQIIINLISNAIDAIEGNPNPWIYISARSNQEFYEIKIVDCGKGIRPEIVKQMFDPFFTSKKVGKGTGLGLSISQKIAEAHRGQLFVDQSAQNTTFILKLVQARYWK
jgi:C4-dicarboxylate-specific signal transduction histidine kinase